ncbi:hypothetical protein [Halococcus dombrowskii]|nr:hypothetical protein [Halococcus dombrowskii]
MDEEGELVKEGRVANADLDGLAQKSKEAKREATTSPSTTS